MDTNVKDRDSKTALYSAADKNHVEFLRVLLESFTIDGLPCGGNTHAKEKILKDAFFFAAKGGHSHVVNALLGVINARNEDGKRVIHLASEAGHIQVVEALVRATHIEINATDEYGTTALHLAARRRGCGEIFEKLLFEEGIGLRQTCWTASMDTLPFTWS